MTDIQEAGFLRGPATSGGVGPLVVVGKNGAPLGPSFEPEGLVADGATDNSAAIQTAIDAAYAAGGGTVLVPAGTYVANNLILKRKVQLVGTSWGSILKAPASQTSAHAVVRSSEESDRDLAYYNFPHHGAVRDLRIDGNARSGAAGDGIRLVSRDVSGDLEPANDTSAQYGSSDFSDMEDWNDPAIQVERVLAVDVGRHGFLLGANCRECHVLDNFALYCRKLGFYMAATDYHVAGCSAGGCGDGFFLRSSEGRVSDCKAFYSWGNHAGPPRTTTTGDNTLSGSFTVNVVDASLFPTSGYAVVGGQFISYSGKTGTSLTGCALISGAGGTVPAGTWVSTSWAGRGTVFSGTGHGVSIFGSAGGNAALSGLQVSNCMTQDNYGFGFFLYETRANVLRSCKSGGDVLGVVRLESGGSVQTENNVVEVVSVWGDRQANSPMGSAAQTLKGVELVGAATKKNHVELHEDEENARAAGFALITETSSALAYDNWIGGNAFEKWTAPTLLNSFTDGNGGLYPLVGYRREGNMVVLRGAVTGGAAGVPAFTLPVGWRPPGKLFFVVTMYDTSGVVLRQGFVSVQSNGNVNVDGMVGATWATADFCWLDNVRIPL